MPKYEDFDTVCYSNQHNIIQLIKYEVEMGEAIEGLQNDVGQLQDQISDVGQSIEDLVGLSGQILDNVADLASIVQTLAELVANHEQRIKALEGS